MIHFYNLKNILTCVPHINMYYLQVSGFGMKKIFFPFTYFLNFYNGHVFKTNKKNHFNFEKQS